MGEDRVFIAALQGVPEVGAKTIRSGLTPRASA